MEDPTPALREIRSKTVAYTRPMADFLGQRAQENFEPGSQQTVIEQILNSIAGIGTQVAALTLVIEAIHQPDELEYGKSLGEWKAQLDEIHRLLR